MPFTYNPDTREIRIAPGDTASILVEIDWAALKPGDVVLFAVYDPSAERGDLFCRAAEIVDGAAHVRLCNSDTRDIPPGVYRWDLRIVTDPARDANGNVIADDCSDHVITVFDKSPKFRLQRGGAYV